MIQHRTIQDSIESVRRFSDYSDLILPAGSMFDGIHVPEFSSISGRVVQEMDFVMVFPNLTARESDSAALQYAFQSESNPAFVSLKVNDPSEFALQDIPVLEERQDPRLKYTSSLGGDTFLNNNVQIVFRRRMQYALSKAFGAFGQSIDMKLKEARDFYPVVTVRVTGAIHQSLEPVESTVWPDKFVNEMFMTWFNIVNEGDKFWLEKIFDLAPAIQGDWPANAKEQWINRTRYWPNQATVAKISSVPCHLVAKPRAQSTNMPLQWRFGFNVAEGILCSKFTVAQRQVLMLLKALRRKYLQSPKVLASYHLKTTMFQFLETTLPSEVEDMSRGQMFLRLLDKLVESLERKSLPSFFLRKSNLLEGVPDDHIKEILEKMKAVREKPESFLTREIFQAITLDREGDEFSSVYLGYV